MENGRENQSKKREVLERFVHCMKIGNNVELADLFDKYGVLHDSSQLKIGRDTVHLEGRMAIEMMYHHRFGFNRGPFPITSVDYKSDDMVWYFIQYGEFIVPVCAVLAELTEEGLIRRMNVYPL